MSGSITLYFSLLLLGMVCLAISFFQWRWSMYFFFVWLLVEGAFRKWFLPGLSTVLIFVKYAIVVGPFMLCLLKNKANYSYPFVPIIFFYFFWGIIEFFNWSATSDIRIFLVGMMIHYSFITLIVTVPAVLNTKQKILRFFRWAAFLAIPILLLGVYQYSLPPSHYLNKYVGDSTSIAGFMGKVRIISTFSYIAPFGQYLFVLLSFLMVLIIQENNKFLSAVYYCCFVLAWLNVFMTASRGVVAVSAILTIGFILLSVSRRNALWQKFVLRILLVGILTVVAFTVSSSGQKSFELLVKRFERGRVSSRVYNMVRIARLQNAGLLGYGIGTEFQGISRILDIRKQFDVVFEGEKDRLVAGIGFVGYCIVMVLRIIIMIWVWGVFFRTKNYSLRIILIFPVACLTQGAILGGVIYNFMANAHYWFSVGLAIAVLRIQHMEKMQQWRLRLSYSGRGPYAPSNNCDLLPTNDS
ncbi:hypothetical protein [Candidatus Uabimicrobium amorphum]|uniref:O-antigen ligase domain-containing protein n=1 Tax=Uabimicrobium amorphum TaxID=2596890 RepID=A0A5S9F405_UABAM|nr:hypothetical protein [Candidatus Uabimicrobium amorphum]BBM85297.1 hypothetical protein UABAM_03661 [Candidatus Uabimicrobium amorphum]